MAEKVYIEREAVISEINEKIGNIGFTSPYQNEIHLIIDGMERARDSVEEALAVDVVEVRHGAWIVEIDYKTPLSHQYIRKEKLYICPYCGKAYRQHMNFCGNCGAKMDGKGDEK